MDSVTSFPVAPPHPLSPRDRHLKATVTTTLRSTPRATATVTFAIAITSGPSPFSLSCPFTPCDPKADPHSHRDNYRDWPFTSPLTSPPSGVSPSLVIPLEKNPKSVNKAGKQTCYIFAENQTLHKLQLEASSSAVLANSKVLDHFVGMEFSREMVFKVIQEYGEENEAKLLEELLTYTVFFLVYIVELLASQDLHNNHCWFPLVVANFLVHPAKSDRENLVATVRLFSCNLKVTNSTFDNSLSLCESEALESFPPPQPLIVTDPSSLGNAGSSWDDFSDTDIFFDEDIENNISDSENDDTLRTLVKMGYKQEEALIAIERLVFLGQSLIFCLRVAPPRFTPISAIGVIFLLR
ncbi:hypothetical protein Fmac_025378 [Flemingia macrophylla]|uniref:UBA domain-containing protein n=1 Tax=Flemingia macrophylla TaxID=520843 RepID=A0ABD1LS43_9FABA